MKTRIREVDGMDSIEQVGDYFQGYCPSGKIGEKRQEVWLVCTGTRDQGFVVEIVEKWRPTVWHYIWAVLTVGPAVAWLLL